MSQQQQPQNVVADPVGEILQTFRAPTGPWEMSRARRLARAARAATLSVGAHGELTAVTVDAGPAGGYVVEVHISARPDAGPVLGRAVIAQVRQAADDRGLGPYLDDVRVVVEGVQ